MNPSDAIILDDLPKLEGALAAIDPVEAARFNAAREEWIRNTNQRLNERRRAIPSSTQLFQGVFYRSPESGIHLLTIHLFAPGVSFATTDAGGTRDTLRVTTLAFLAAQGAKLAINAHFFLPTGSDLNANIVGFGASRGVVTSPFEPQPIEAGFQDQSYAIMPFAPALNIAADNVVSILNQGQEANAFNAVSGSAQIVTAGQKSIPTYPDDLSTIEGYSAQNSWYEHEVRGRTCIGFSRDRQRLFILVADDNPGLTVSAAADRLVSMGAYSALNLDGGTSAALAINDSQGARYLNDATNRTVGSNFAVFANAVV